MVEYARKVIHISAMDSPNVKLALEQQRRGLKPTGEEILPGVINWETYCHRRKVWDESRQCRGLDGQFYEGAEIKMYPPDWLNRAEQYAATLQPTRLGKAMGVDTAEGGDDTCWSIIDDLGLIKQVSLKTPDTSVITGRTIALMREYNVAPSRVIFDQGGGGKEHADRLRAQGYAVRLVAFGESPTPDPVPYRKDLDTQIDDRRERYSFRNRRAQMYWMLRQRLDPYGFKAGQFGIPLEYTELRRQLSLIPLEWDEEGRLVLLPKRRKPHTTIVGRSLEELVGNSPDESDSLAMAVFALDGLEDEFSYSPMF